MADDLESALKASPLSQAQRADLWDLYHGAASSDDLAAKLQSLNVPKSVKATLWDLKSKETLAPPVTPSQPAMPPNLQAQGGDTINGVDPNAPLGLSARIARGLRPLAQPQSGLDLLSLGGLSSAPIAESVLPKVVAPVVDAAGRGMSALGNAFKSTGKYLGVGDVLYHRGGLAEGAVVTAAPYVLDLAGQAAQKGAAILRRDAPLLQFKLGAVETPTAATVQAAREAAPVATAAAPAMTPEALQAARAANPAPYDVAIQKAKEAAAVAPKPRLNAAQIGEYVKMVNSGKTPTEAYEAIQAQEAFRQRFGLPDAETVRATRGTNKERILRNTP